MTVSFNKLFGFFDFFLIISFCWKKPSQSLTNKMNSLIFCQKKIGLSFDVIVYYVFYSEWKLAMRIIYF